MSPRLPLALAPLLCLSALLSGPLACGSGNEITDLQLVQTVVVEFGAMEGDVPSLTSPGDVAFDLREEADWVRLHRGFRCVAADPDGSGILISRLLAPGLDTMLTLQIDVMPRGGVTWKPLVELNGTVTDGGFVPWSDPSVTIFADGVDLLEAIALSENPGYELRITGEVPAAIDDLVVDLLLELDFSTLAGGCPHPD
ncbi:MAG: hypothetical protein H6744_09245 [Deltaproteobacteria bacterium]|nr:hypothetical protein [Deltaproteobacteria bacterium]